jgi:Right handed beta helix region
MSNTISSNSKMNIYFIALIFSIVSITFGAFYVTPNGVSGNNGKSFSEPLNYTTALSRAVAGDTILLQGGTYSIPYTPSSKNTIVVSKSGSSGKPISIIAANNSRAIFNFSYPNNSKVIDENVTSYGFEITGSFWYFRGLDITKAGYQGVYTTGSNITFENCAFYENWNSGLEINKGGSNVTVINCDAYRNFDGAYKNGSMADGFASKQTQGSGNRFIGCRAWENSDDGYDTYDSPEAVTFENCQAFCNGVNVWNFSGFTGNGNGFKIGGNAKLQNNKLSRCIVFGQPGKGFDQNNNTGGLTLYNCFAFGNGTNYALGGTLETGQKHKLSNNVSLSGSVTIKNATEKNNTWNTGFSVSNADFLSIDTSLARKSRDPDGSLPRSDLFSLKGSSVLIDNGTDIGLSYSGRAPDIGCIEYENPVVINDFEHQVCKEASSFSIYVNGNFLECRNNPTPLDGELEIISSVGKLIMRNHVDNTLYTKVRMPDLVPGIYIFRFSSNEYQISKRFVWYDRAKSFTK